ncbi:30S ribosomal protein S3 [Paenibacillus thiaminolyticus]|uniref:Small ribosomal subunit protein uS3 n=2 Tax=Paenibacillus TaxID=44249 RepID=H3SEM6_9BACL|nr:MULTISPECIES: 30S ribosomal protein S3 [Paenibacillus]EHQ62474.1 30S ribosomal protein S3 [Paenibacillus dendritiformis C454]MCY9537521.1 30S ribosomal protein S3 [Paenibacillus thiaminolyticus]MCY9604782.1 30S ribosomal protein S3 [Paenibacillus thiaminolyticus]MCY9609666.1 30S ribosomal protein S3 [Paenibacillus thiaminolyticus]MCY9615432.1 30S ribosomal protein S3 [Paenibacillus thiaminolyticus]
MGQKVNPVGLRVGIIRDWESKWYAEKDFGTLLIEDVKIREYLKNKLKDAAVSRIEIERAANRVNVTIHTAKPGMVIGKGGSEVEALRREVTTIAGGKKVHINISEIKTPDLDAILVAESIAQQLERRVSFRRALKQALQRSMRAGAKGIKTAVSGRLGGAEIARSEGYSEGTVPLHTLRADIDYGTAEAHTTYGRLGVKVWIYRGEVLPTAKKKAAQEGGN